MMPDESVTEWIVSLKVNEQTAAQHLYERYIERLLAVARRKLRGMPRRAADEEDVAQVVMNSFFGGVRKGRFPKLDDRQDLWQVLVMITERKVIDQMRQQLAKKRGPEVGESALFVRDQSGSGLGGIEQAMGREPAPAFAAEVAEELNRRIAQLDNDELRQIAVWKLEGRTNAEIARKLGCVTRTVERRLDLIRNLWQST